MTDAEKLAHVLKIIEDEQRLEAYEAAQTERAAQPMTTLRATAFRQIANLMLYPGKARW